MGLRVRKNPLREADGNQNLTQKNPNETVG
jgi:hypothetical protein